MDKSKWRAVYRKKRAELTESQRTDLAKKIGTQLSSVLTSSDRFIHLFLPIEKFNEVNTWLVKETVENQFSGINWLVSSTDFTEEKLLHFYLEKDTKIAINAFGIPEPVNAKGTDIKQLTTVLVPLLAIDKNGHRLGYGKGFYDRFLAECPKNCRTIGLSFFEPEETTFPTDSWDIPLQYCVTPNGVHSFIK